MKQEEFINNLTKDFRAPGRWRPYPVRFAFFFAALFLGNLVLFLLVQDFRPGFSNQLIAYPRFLLEILTSTIFVMLALFFIFKTAVPGEEVKKNSWFLLTLLGGLFLISLASSFFLAQPESSMIGKRPWCVFEVLIYGAINLGVLFYMIRNGIVRRGGFRTMLFGLSVALLPGLMMQLACMYDPVHGFLFHYLPVVGVGFLGYMIGRTKL